MAQLFVTHWVILLKFYVSWMYSVNLASVRSFQHGGKTESTSGLMIWKEDMNK